MSRLRNLTLIILIGIAASAGTGLLYGQSYASYPLYLYGEHADIASDNNNNLHMIWLRYGVLYYGRIVNNAITGTQTIPGTASVAIPWSWPHIAVSPSGATVHVTWVQHDHRNLFHSWRNASGTWTTETVWTATYSKFYWPVCAIDAAGNVHMIYGQSPGDGNCDVFYSIKNTSGSWSTPVEISGGDAHLNTTNPDFNENDMFSDSNGGIHAKWSLISTKYMRYRYCASGGNLASSATEYVLDNSSDSIGPGDLHVEKSGAVHMAINAYNGYVNMDHTYKPVGGSWLAPTRASNGPVGSTTYEIWPTIAVPRDGTNRVFVAWAEGGSLVKLSIKTNSTWTLYNLDTAAGMGDNWIKPAMTATNSGIYGIWRSSSFTQSWVLGVVPTNTLAITAPNGGENWVRTTTQPITWNSSGLSGTVKLLLYQNLSLIGTIAQDLAIGAGTYSWTVGNLASGSAPAGSNYKIRVQTTDNTISDDSDGTFNIISEVEAVAAPGTLSGPGFGSTGASYSYSTGGAVSSLGHTLQYKFDWGDGTDSGWLAVGTTSASHSWSSTGTYSLRTMARCSLHTAVESPWSTTLAVVIAVPGAYYNSPANRLILPEVNWAPAIGGGTWVTEVQIVDMTGGAVVQVYYNSGTNRRGPFTLWTNSGGANRSVTFGNILQTIDGLDAGAFTYFGTNGGLEIITQDASHLLQAGSRSYNGNFTCTFPALQDVETNTAALGRSLLVPNISNNTAYRPKVSLFNCGSSSATVEVRIIGSNGIQVGSTITRILAGYEMNTILDEVRAYNYDNAAIRIDVTSGSGRVLVCGQSTNNLTNDPAAHVAVQTGAGYVNSPANRLILPEVNWAPAIGGGTWVTEVQIVDMTGGAVVQVYYNSGTNRRGPFTLWTNSGGANRSVTFGNILQTIDGLDAGAFTYFGTNGGLEIITQDASHLLQAGSRSYNGNFTCTFPALQDVETNTAALGRSLLVPNISNNTAYRPKVSLFNCGSSSATVEVRIIGSNGIQVGSTITRILAGYEMNTILDEVRAYNYDNAAIRIDVTSGSGRVLVCGQSTNNLTNDPAAHIAVQGQ